MRRQNSHQELELGVSVCPAVVSEAWRCLQTGSHCPCTAAQLFQGYGEVTASLHCLPSALSLCSSLSVDVPTVGFQLLTGLIGRPSRGNKMFQVCGYFFFCPCLLMRLRESAGSWRVTDQAQQVVSCSRSLPFIPGPYLCPFILLRCIWQTDIPAPQTWGYREQRAQVRTGGMTGAERDKPAGRALGTKSHSTPSSRGFCSPFSLPPRLGFSRGKSPLPASSLKALSFLFHFHLSFQWRFITPSDYAVRQMSRE